MLENSSRTQAMKKLGEKFKQNVNFVRPLYRKVKFSNRVQPAKKLFVSVDVNDEKLGGNGVRVKRKIVKDIVDYNVVTNNVNSDYNSILPGACDEKYQISYTRLKPKRNVNKFGNTLRKNEELAYYVSELEYGKMDHSDFTMDNNKSIQAENSKVSLKAVPVSWLRVYPAPQERDESTLSVIFRCLFCQLGLGAFLVLWTILWVFIIQHFEGPFENEVSNQFEKEQNQLVIDLATELRQELMQKFIRMLIWSKRTLDKGLGDEWRLIPVSLLSTFNHILQITPISPKWRFAIEKRIEEERMLTIMAVGRGAMLRPGHFWDLSGTFLFSVYVMTALGFGAPVPHTLWGRTSALVYSALAVPTHIYLKSPNRSRTSELAKRTTKAACLRRKVMRVLSILYIGRCVPAASLLYYACGVVAFGAVRGRNAVEAAMFPLEFTTTGGLELVSSPVRICYGLYVEGAMSLLACALATLRAHSSYTTNNMAAKYRLFVLRQPS